MFIDSLFYSSQREHRTRSITINTHSKMNPLHWVVFALLALDAVRELMGFSSILGMW
ncbi:MULTISPECIES: KPN_01571 family protein [Citrobacter]|uniref:KPN_01571 family protein n=1 Tax=Citrobacter TaxID=544 RepID=UPI001C0A6D9F|nr:KPN_01571 family protein [Citrobacter amalonaticus]QZA38491.1 KPN_01571 family protein [Citrobacter amalonaticus]